MEIEREKNEQKYINSLNRNIIKPYYTMKNHINGNNLFQLCVLPKLT